VFGILAELSAGRPCDISGIDGYDALEAHRGVQWPCAAGAEVVTGDQRRLFADGRFHHPDGRARFVFETPRRVAEPPSPAFPLILLTGRGSSSQWHTQTRSAKSPVLQSLAAKDPYVEVAPSDADERGIEHGEWVQVLSPRGSMRARARVTPIVAAGQVFVPMHYAETNLLTNASFDPYSRQPSYKHGTCDVRTLRRRLR
jgi:assimilatory nitrate reductase catalytic subunit